MSFAVARQAIRDRIEAGWTATDIPLTWANENQVLPEEAFVSIDVIAEGPAEIAAVGGGRGANLMRQHGRVEMHCFVPINEGTSRAWRMADAAAAILRTQRFETGGVAISCFESGPDGGGSRADDGKFWRVTDVTIFHADYVG